MLTQDQIKTLFHLELDEHNTIHLEFTSSIVDSDSTNAMATSLQEEVLDIFSKHPGKKFYVCIDLSDQKQEDQHIPKKARGIYINLMKHEQIEKIAVIGGNVVYRVVLNVFAGLAGKKNRYKLASSKEEALDWLQNLQTDAQKQSREKC